MIRSKSRTPPHHPLAIITVLLTAILLSLGIYTYSYSRNLNAPATVIQTKTVRAAAILPDTPEQTTILAGMVREASGNGYLTIQTSPVVDGMTTDRLIRVNLTNDTRYYILSPLPTEIADPHGSLPQRVRTKAPTTNLAIGATIQITAKDPVSGNTVPTAREIDIYTS